MLLWTLERSVLDREPERFFLDLRVFSRTRQPGGNEWWSSLVAIEGTIEPEVSGESRSSHRVKEVGQVRSEVGLLQVRPVLVLGSQPGLEVGPPGGHGHQVLVHHHLQLVHHLVELGQVRRVERTSVYICRPTTVRAIELIVHLGEALDENQKSNSKAKIPG